MWPNLPLLEWRDTYRTLHLYLQIVGKVRLALAPKLNQWWNVPLYVTARGLSTSAMPYRDRTVQIDIDFIAHELLVSASDGRREVLPLAPRTVADFHRKLFAMLQAIDVDVHIRPVPVEIPFKTPFTDDTEHRIYVAEHAYRFWDVLRRVNHTFEQFRARFRGKCSPVHFFWGSCDLAVTRFSGRPAPERKGSVIERDAYDEEEISHGFWPGEAWADENPQDAAFYAYSAPEPQGFSSARVKPAAAFYSDRFKEFLLPYEAVRSAPRDPSGAIVDFMQSTYEAGSMLANWNRASLEYEEGRGDPITLRTGAVMRSRSWTSCVSARVIHFASIAVDIFHSLPRVGAYMRSPAVFSILLISTITTLASADNWSPPPSDKQAIEIARLGREKRSACNVEGSKFKMARADIIVAANVANVRTALLDHAQYKTLFPKLRLVKVLRKTGQAAEVYMTLPVMNGAANIWAVQKMDAPAPEGSGEKIVGHFVKGNVEDLRTTWHYRAIDATHTLLSLEMFISLNVPVPASVVNDEVDQACAEGVVTTRKVLEAQANKH